MEADNGYKVKTEETGTLEGTRPVNPRTVAWRGDWEIFKEEFFAAAECSGTGSAVELAERLAAGEELENLTKHNNELVQKGRAESRRLKTQLTLSLIATQGAQQMLVRGGLQRDMDGVDTWMRLVKHFEYTAKGQRTQELHTRWEGETLQPGEHPEHLYIRLVTLQRQLAALDDELSQNNLTRKLLAALRNGNEKIYGPVIREYNRDLVRGRPLELNQLLELLSLEHRQAERAVPSPEQTMVGLASAKKCTHCKKQGHSREECWNLRPDRRTSSIKSSSKKRPIRCFKCNEIGHIARECKQNAAQEVDPGHDNNENNENMIDLYQPTYVDSACQCHTTTSLKLLDKGTVTRANKVLVVANGATLTLTHKGRRTIRTGQGVVRLNQVYYADGLHYNLVSVPTMAKSGAKAVLGNDKAYIEKNGQRIHLKIVDGLWALPEKHGKLGLACLRMQRGGSASAAIWHRRLGHPGDRKLDQMIKSGIAPREAASYPVASCQTCQLTHPRKRPVPTTAERSGKVTIQVDYMPLGQQERGWKGEVGAYVFSSRSSKTLKAYPVTTASAEDATCALRKYCTFILPLLGEKVECMQTDAGTQFNSQEWKQTCAEHGLAHRTCPIDHQAMNGQVERAIGVLAEKTRALLMDRQTHKKYWPLALEAATYQLNRTPHESLGGMSPLEKSRGEKSDLNRARVFGCKAYVQIPKSQRRGKLSNTAWTGIMVGYSTQSPEWIILDPKSRRLRNAYSVTFDEETSGPETSMHGAQKPPHAAEEIVEIGDPTPAVGNEPEAPHGTEEEMESVSGNTQPELMQELSNSGPPESADEGMEETDGDITHLRVQEDQLLSLALCMAMTTRLGIEEPKSWRKAIDIPHWKDAMVREKKELEDMKAWDLVPRPAEATVLPGVWRFRIKRDENGDIARYKARRCVGGSRDAYYRQPETTYSPVAEHTTIRCLFALAAAMEQPVLQADFPNAYLNTEIGENMYMRQASGLEEKDKENWVYKLKKALYGSPVSGNRWHRALEDAIEALGYRRSSIDHCLFSRVVGTHTDLLVIYVDDVLVASTGGEARANVQLDELGTKFSIKKLGLATHMLGIGVRQGEDYTTLDQTAYLRTVLAENKFMEAKPKGAPLDPHLVEDEDPLGRDEVALYRRVVGQLMYLSTITRPDIAFSVGRIASGMASPTKGHWARVKRILRYLSGTIHSHLRYKRGAKDLILATYVDASYGIDPKRGRSISGYANHLGTGPVYWRSHLQPTVADSPNAAEYIALYEAAKSAMGTHNLLTEMGADIPAPLLLEDNDGARRLTAAGMGQKKARHLQIKHHYVQELRREGRVRIDRLSGAD